MQNKKFGFITAIMASMMFMFNAYSDENADFELASAQTVAEYDVEGSLFEQITSLEQEKVLMQLEKEKAQLDLELDKLAAEKIKLNMEIDTLSGRAEQQQQQFDNERAKLEAEAEKIERERQNLANQTIEVKTVNNVSQNLAQEKSPSSQDITKLYKLINVLGAGSQLQATLEDLSTGQQKRVSAGKTVNGFMVKSISLDEGVVFVKDGETYTLNIANR